MTDTTIVAVTVEATELATDTTTTEVAVTQPSTEVAVTATSTTVVASAEATTVTPSAATTVVTYTESTTVIATGSIGPPGPAGGDSVPYAIQLDDAGSGVTYVGEADPGTATSTAGWRIKRLTETGPDVAVAWADGDANFNNVWTNRASLTYT